MSDDNGDAPFEDAVPRAGDGSIDGRLDSIHRGLSTLGTRIDALVTSTTTYRSALTDRLTEYSNLVSNITRTHAAQLEEHRQANEQAVAQLRHSLAASEETLTRMGQRIDELVDGPAADSAPVLDEVRGILAAQEELRRTMQDSLDRFGERFGAAQPAADQLGRIERELESSGKVAAESWGELAGLRAKIDAVLETSANESGAVSTLLDELREVLLDVASGEVVGALWEEFRAARESLDTLVSRTDQTAGGGDDEATERLRADVGQLTTAIRKLLEQAEVVEPDEPDGGGDADGSDAVLGEIASDIAALRSELSEGLVVEPSEALAGTVDQLRAELSGLDERMRSITELRDEVAELRAAAESASADAEEPDVATSGQLTEVRAAMEASIESLRSGLDGINQRLAEASAATDEITDADVEGELRILRTGVEGVDAELRSLRSGVEDIIGRLDEGLTLSEDVAPPAAATPETGDEIAALRDQVSTEFDTLRHLLDGLPARSEPESPPEVEVDVDLSPITELLEHVRDDLAELPSRIRTPEPSTSETATTGPEYASIDPDTVDLLREEIRAAGGVSEELLDAVRNDLVALRRRIKLRAEGELFTDEQLDHIAEAVARRLAE